jgi:hypothetical protein
MNQLKDFPETSPARFTSRNYQPNDFQEISPACATNTLFLTGCDRRARGEEKYESSQPSQNVMVE